MTAGPERRRRLRIAVVHSFYSLQQPSGENSAVRSHLAALERVGHDVRLFAAHTDELRPQSFYKVRAGLRVATGWGNDPESALRRYAPDIIYVHNLFPNFGRNWVKSIGIPVVAVLHNYRPLCVNGLLFRDGGVCTLCPDGHRWAGVRYACYRDSHVASLPLAWANRRGPARNPLLANASRVIVLSELQHEVYRSAGMPDEKLIVVPNFLPDDVVPETSATGEDEPREGWVFVGRLTEEKGAVELVKQWPGTARLRIVGEGPLAGELAEAARGKQIELLGQQPRSSVIRLMRRSRGVVFSSLWYEGCPLVYLEALACGTPVLAVGPSVVGRLVRQEKTGIHVDWEGLERALAEVGHDAAKVADRCRAVFEDRYTEAAFTARLDHLHMEMGLDT